MIEAYEIGVSLVVDDAITGSLANIYEQFDKIDGEVSGINRALSRTNSLIGSAAGSIEGLTTAFGKATEAANALRDANAGIGAGGYPGGSGVPGAAGVQGGAMPDPTPALMPGETPYHMPGHQPSGGSNLPALIPGNDYSSGDTSNNFYRHGYADRGGLGPNSRGNDYTPDWTYGGQPQDEAFNRPKPISLMDGGEGAAGDAMHMGLSDLFFGKAVMDMAGNIVAQGFGSVATPQDQITRMRLQNKAFTAADGQKAMAAAREIVKTVPGISLAGALSIIANGYTQTRDIDESVAMALPLAQDAARLEASGRGDAVDGLFQLQQAAEVAGTLNQKNADGSVNISPFTGWIDNQTSILQSDPMVTTNDIWLQTQQNDMGAMTFSTEGQSEQDILAGLLGGYKSGTGGAQLERELIGGKMSTGTEHILEKLGLIDPAGATKTGQYYTLAPHALKDEDLFITNPTKWFQTTFQEAVDHLSPNDRNAMYHDLIAGTGTASGARSAVLDVMQDSFIARQLYYAEHDEPSKAQSMAIINSNPSTTARQVGDNLGVWENSALSWIVDKSIPWLHWESDRANGYATHPLRQLWDDTKDGTAMVAGLAENSVKAFFDYATNGAADGNVAADVRARPVGSGLLNALFTKIDTLSENVVNIVKAIEGQPGGAASTPVYVKQVPGTPMTLMPSTQTGHNPTLSPPVPGQVYNPK